MINRFVSWLRRLGSSKAYSMAIVRRYVDANGAYVGELYLLGMFCGTMQYVQIGMSLDTLAFEAKNVTDFRLDTENDFLQPMPLGHVRVGSQDPMDTKSVQEHVRKLAKEGRIILTISNNFCEHVLNSSRKTL